MDDRQSGLSLAAVEQLSPQSLVGSFFHTLDKAEGDGFREIATNSENARNAWRGALVE